MTQNRREKELSPGEAQQKTDELIQQMLYEDQLAL